MCVIKNKLLNLSCVAVNQKLALSIFFFSCRVNKVQEKWRFIGQFPVMDFATLYTAKCLSYKLFAVNNFTTLYFRNGWWTNTHWMPFTHSVKQKTYVKEFSTIFLYVSSYDWFIGRKLNILQLLKNFVFRSVSLHFNDIKQQISFFFF